MGADTLSAPSRHHPLWHGAAVLLCLLALLLTNPAQVRAQTGTQTGAQEEVSSTVMDEVVRRPAWGLYQGYAQYKMAHYAQARAIWQLLADGGTSEAWFHLGTLAEDGRGEPANPVEARRRYEKGAAGGSSKAQWRLGLMLQTSTPALGPADPERALAYLEQLGRDGDVDARLEAMQLRQRMAATVR